MTELPQIGRLSGAGPGPTLGLLGGVHGDELEGVLAVRTVLGRVPAGRLQGTIRFAAPAHPDAWAADSRTSPLDGSNLARVFPGNPSGTPTEQVAAHLTSELIAGCDLLIDLHSAGRGFDMPLLAGYHSTGPLAERAGAAARAFAAPFLWQHPDPSAGRSLSAAEALGVPSIYVEGRGGGRLRQRDLDGYVDGVLRVMVYLGMLDEAPQPGEVVTVRGDGNTDEGITATSAGYFVAAAEVGQRVTAGAVIGRIVGDDGGVIEEITAPATGAVMLLRRGARVVVGDTLTLVGTLVEQPSGDPTGEGEASR